MTPERCAAMRLAAAVAVTKWVRAAWMIGAMKSSSVRSVSAAASRACVAATAATIAVPTAPPIWKAPVFADHSSRLRCAPRRSPQAVRLLSWVSVSQRAIR